MLGAPRHPEGTMGPYFTLVPRSRTHRTSAAAAITVVAMFLLGCGDSTGSTGPSTPTSAAAVFADATQPHAAASTMLVNMHDACDSTTFNAAVGAGTCGRQGGVRFDDFIAQ